MATSVLTASSDRNTNLTFSEDHNNLLHHYDHHPKTATPPTARRDHHQTSRQNRVGPARRKQSSSRKKQPQRGMGVAQLERLRLGDKWVAPLERLRLGDRWKIMTEINPQAQSPHSSVPYAVIPTSSGQDPASINTVPMHLAELGVYPSNLNQPAMLVQRVGNTSATMGLFHGKGLVFSDDKCSGNLHGVGVENGSETHTKELSSTPSPIKCYPDHCSVCHLKKRAVFVEKNLVLKGSVKDVNAAEMPSITSSDFVGLNVGNSPYNNRGTNQDFGKTTTFYAGTYSSGGTMEQGTVEDVAVQRKASSSRGTGSGRLFYEFFPSGIGVSRSESHESDQNEELTRMMMMKEVDGSESSSSVSVAIMGCGGDASCATTTTTTGGVVDGSNSIDLSLRLSY